MFRLILAVVLLLVCLPVGANNKELNSMTLDELREKSQVLLLDMEKPLQDCLKSRDEEICKQYDTLYQEHKDVQNQIKRIKRTN